MKSIVGIAKFAGTVSFLAAVLAACASAPTQEMSDARQSVQVAHEVGADQYAAQNLRVARDYLERAERELELRYFSRARHDAIVAKSEAIKAHNVSLALKAAQAAIDRSTAGDQLIGEATALLSEAVEAAEQGKDRRAVRLAEDARRKAEGATLEN